MRPPLSSPISLVSLSLLLFALGCGEPEDSDANTNPDTNEQEPSNQLDPPHFQDTYDFSRDDLHPEGGDYDPITQSFYVGSITHGNITRLEAHGTESIFFAGNGEEDRITLGIRTDSERRRLWVCSILNDGVEPGIIWAFDLDDATLLHEFDLTLTFPDASCNDIEIDSQGQAYITDRQNPHVYRITLEDQSVEIWAEDELLTPELIGLNGIIITPEEEAIIVTKFSPPHLIHISVDDPQNVQEITFEGDAFTGNHAISGADGLTLRDTVMRLDFENNWTHAYVSSHPLSSGLTAVITADQHIYALKGEVVEFVVGLDINLPFQLIQIDLTIF